MSESQYVTNIIKEINALGGKAVKFVETEYSEKGTPDIVGCINGRMFVIEAKIYPNETSEIQNLRLNQWAKAGAFIMSPSYPYTSAHEVAIYVLAAST